MKLKINNEYKMVFPFYKINLRGSPGNALFAKREDSYIWYAGCDVHTEQYDEGHGERFFTAHGEGKVIYKILSLAKMPGRFQNRVIFKRWLIDPDFKKYNNGEVRMLTEKSFIRDVESVTPFRADYEVEEND